MHNRLYMELSPSEAQWLDRAIAGGRFDSREGAIHSMLDRAMSLPNEEEIVEAYRRAYESVPEDEAWGKAGLALLSRRLQDDQG